MRNTTQLRHSFGVSKRESLALELNMEAKNEDRDEN
jgi:hypothetical protein